MARKTILTAVLCGVLAVLGIGQAFGQERPGRGERGERGERAQRLDPEQLRERMAQMRERQAERMKEQLGIADEEWPVLQPMIEKVQTLRQQLNAATGAGRMAVGGRRGGRAAPAEGEDAAPAPEIARTAQSLREVLQDENATAAQIAGALTAFRAAREKARHELAQAQEELRQVVTARQEAILVTMGLLE